MKKSLFLIPFVLFVSCSTPKFAANRINLEERLLVAGSSSSNSKHQRAAAGEATASLKTVPSLSIEQTKAEIKKTYFNLSKSERQEVRQLLKKEIKSIIKNQQHKKEMSPATTKSSSIDHDLKLAAIFGAVGIVGLILGGPAGQFFTVIGAIALIIGVVFFVKWLIRQ